MAIVMKRTSKWWYALFKSNGKRKAINLRTTIDGQRPASLTQRGDDDFERSRGKAIAEHDRLLREFEADRTGARTLQNLAEIKAGRRVSFPALAELANHWEQIPRRKVPDPQYAKQSKNRLERFTAFVTEKQPDAVEFVSVKPETARAFMEAETTRGVSPKTWNDTLKLLRATFKHLHPQLNDGNNPFHGLVTKASETINREPFTVEELKAITEACAADDFIRPIIVTGMCTAMRRGDCCLLKWEDVDEKAGFLSVKTAKTGETVDIPIFPMLAEELAKARCATGGSGFCFPEAARMYQGNPDGITWRVKQVIARALDSLAAANRPLLPAASPDEIEARVAAHIDGLGESSKASKMRAVFATYSTGASLNEVMASTGCSRGTVSNYLNELERITGATIIRGKKRAAKTEGLQEERENGKRRASVHDFHSFRVTWITLALAAGVPLELVQRVTGHRTVAVVLKHYFRPGREDFRQHLLKAMPSMLGERTKTTAKEEMRSIVEHVTPSSWKSDKARLLELITSL
jgi:integrase